MAPEHYRSRQGEEHTIPPEQRAASRQGEQHPGKESSTLHICSAASICIPHVRSAACPCTHTQRSYYCLYMHMHPHTAVLLPSPYAFKHAHAPTRSGPFAVTTIGRMNQEDGQIAPQRLQDACAPARSVAYAVQPQGRTRQISIQSVPLP